MGEKIVLGLSGGVDSAVAAKLLQEHYDVTGLYLDIGLGGSGAADAAAVARQTLGRPAQRMEVEASGNIIKNVKSVIVPNTGGLRGIETAVAAGLVSGQPDRKLEVLAALEPSQQVQIRSLLRRSIIRVFPAQNDELLYIEICLRQKNGGTARAVLERELKD